MSNRALGRTFWSKGFLLMSIMGCLPRMVSAYLSSAATTHTRRTWVPTARSRGHSTENLLTPLPCAVRSSLMMTASLSSTPTALRSDSSSFSTLVDGRNTDDLDTISTKSSTGDNASNSSMSSFTTRSRLTHEEQMDLLREAVEMRRIKALEASLALQSPSLRPSRLAVAVAAGYGSQVDELELALDRGQVARETLVTRNMGLVHYCVNDILGKKYSKRPLQSLSREDLIQEGAIGLARAVDRWNPAVGGRFSTYAVYWIRAAVWRCIAERDDLMRVPEHVSTAVRKMTRAAQTLGLDLDGDRFLSTVYGPGGSWKEAQAAKALAEAAGLSDRQLKEAMKVRQRRSVGMLSFESWMQQGRHYESDLAPLTAEDEEVTADREALKKSLSRFLRPREMEALSWRYGLITEEADAAARPRDTSVQTETSASRRSGIMREAPVRGKWGEAMSFVEVGKRMEISAEYGRRLCHVALEKLRRAADDGKLELGLLF